MAKQKKLQAQAANPAAVTLISEQDEAADLPIVLETHRVTRTWQENKPLDEVETELQQEDEVLEEEDEAPKDPIQKLLSEMAGASANWSMGVYRLKNYARDRRTSPDARAFCGVLTIPDAEYIVQEVYKEDIQARWSRGSETNYFVVCMRRNNRIWCWMPAFGIEPPDPVTLAKQQAENPTVQIYGLPSQQNPADMWKQWKVQLKEFAEIQQMLSPAAAAAAAITPAQPQINSTEQALLHLMNADGGMVESIAEKLRGLIVRRSERGEVGWMDLAMEAIRTDLPGRMIREAKNLIIEVRNTALPPDQQRPPEPYTPPAPVNQAQQPAQPAGANPLPPELTLLNFTLQACAQQWQPEDAAAWIVEFEAHNPSVTAFINLFMGRTPEQALQWLSTAVPEAAHIAALPHANQWITDVQAALKASEETDGETTPNQQQ